jgi:hypothetical protein
MKDLSFLAILVGLGLLFMIFNNREGFSKEFIDRSNEEKTDQTRVSSYRQETNHFKPTHALQEPPHGIETPFRVNQYNSYVPA